MTNRPRLVALGPRIVPGLLAFVLFGVLVAMVWSTSFQDELVGFPEGISITAEIGYALFDYHELQHSELAATEPFLISFLLIAVLLDAALDASLVLAKREDEGESAAPASFDAPVAGGASPVTGATATDGGREATEDVAAEPARSAETIDGDRSADGGDGR